MGPIVLVLDVLVLVLESAFRTAEDNEDEYDASTGFFSPVMK